MNGKVVNDMGKTEFILHELSADTVPDTLCL